MRRDPLRSLRLKWDDRRDPGIDRNRLRTPGLGMPTPRGSPRFVGRVFSGGAVPHQPNRVFLVHPVRLEGDELEGAPTALIVDSSRTIPVVVIGSRAPEVDDLLVAVSIGGRWVADRWGGGSMDWLDPEDPEGVSQEQAATDSSSPLPQREGV